MSRRPFDSAKSRWRPCLHCILIDCSATCGCRKHICLVTKCNTCLLICRSLWRTSDWHRDALLRAFNDASKRPSTGSPQQSNTVIHLHWRPTTHVSNFLTVIWQHGHRQFHGTKLPLPSVVLDRCLRMQHHVLSAVTIYGTQSNSWNRVVANSGRWPVDSGLRWKI
jgi:hypothetical protein